MQQRYCDCGREIWVEYRFVNTMCRVYFRPEGRETCLLARCPRCGRRLDIDELG